MPSLPPRKKRRPAKAKLICFQAAKATLQGRRADGKPRFQVYAYSGSPMNLSGWEYPVVIDLAGVRFVAARTPVIQDHDTRLRIGHTDTQTANANGIRVSGPVSASTPEAKAFVADSKAGFPFQASLGADVREQEFIPAGESVRVNGHRYDGPLIVARQTLIREISVTVLGADSQTSALAASRSAPRPQSEHTTMPKKRLTAHLRNRNPDRRQRPPGNSKAIIAAERNRIKAIDDFLRPPANGWGTVQPEVDNLRAQAIDGEIALAELPDRVSGLIELRAVRSGYPEPTGDDAPLHDPGFAPGIHSRSRLPADTRILEASLARRCGVDIQAAYGERIAHAADRVPLSSGSVLLDAAKLVCQMAGRQLDTRSKDTVIRAAFSTGVLSDLLSNVAGKNMEQAYRAFPSIVRRIARKLSPDDFKEHTSLRIVGDSTFVKLDAQGEIKHGTLEDQKYPYSVDTFARMFGIDRQAMRNDDLAALSETPRILGRGAAVSVEENFWAVVLANTGNFFSAANANLLTGAGTALTGTTLGQAVQKFLEQVDKKGKPVAAIPRWLVVPPAQKVLADELYTARTWNLGLGDTQTETRIPGESAFFGLYEPLVSPWLGTKAGLANASDIGWYLFGDPADIAAFGIAYLDGIEVPTVEVLDQAPQLLGVNFRGYLDHGACQIDHRGAVMAVGTPPA